MLAGAIVLLAACTPTIPPEPIVHGPGTPEMLSDSAKWVIPNDSSSCQHQANGFTTSTKRHAFISDCTRRYRVANALVPEGIRMEKVHWMIPEFHDEQRFVVRETGKFGPVANIYASPALGGFDHEGQLREHYDRGMLAAVIFVDTLAAPGVVLPHVYARLGLRPALNCLWIRFEPGLPRPWRAFMNQPAPGNPCDPLVKATAELAIQRRTSFPGLAKLTPADVPAVARFTWDAERRPLLGVRCLVGWCDIGPANRDGSPAFTPLNLAALVPGLPKTRESLIPAWHDEQTLAAHGPGDAVLPGTIDATVIPLVTKYQAPEWYDTSRPIAIVYLHSDPAGTPYGDKWGLKKGANMIHLRRGTGSWTAAFRSNDGVVHRWTNVERHPHFDAAVIPTARFRWASADDGIWVGCGQACCRMEGDS